MQLDPEETCSKCVQLDLYHPFHPFIMLAQKRAKQAISSSRTYWPTALKYLLFILLINKLSIVEILFFKLKTAQSAQDVAGTAPFRGIQTSHELLWHMYSMQWFCSLSFS